MSRTKHIHMGSALQVSIVQEVAESLAVHCVQSDACCLIVAISASVNNSVSIGSTYVTAYWREPVII